MDEQALSRNDAERAASEAESAAPQQTRPTSYLDDEGCAWIPESRYDLLADKAAKLNKRAAKLGCSPIGVCVREERFKPIRDEHTDIVRYRREVRVQITGSAPQVAGWTFVARIQHGEGGNIVSKAPSERETALDEALWLADPVCDHCHTKRGRKDTFILRAQDGSRKQVGRNCLADFLRTADVEMALAFWKYLYEIERDLGGGEDEDEGGWGGGCGRHYFDLNETLLAAARAIRVDGWTSRSAAKAYEEASGGRHKDATSDTVGFILDPPWGRGPQADEVNREIRAKLATYAPVEHDTTVATATLEWIRRRLDPQSDYERNLKVALTPDYVEPKNLGLVVSAVQAWLRFSNQYEAKKLEARPDAGYVGEVGKRLRNIPCKVTFTKTWTNDMTGFVTNLLVFVDAEGHEFKWFASGSRGLEVGRDVLLTGTVKAHEEFRGRKGTLLSRCIVEVA